MQYKYKYRIKTSKNNKKTDSTGQTNRQEDRIQIQVYKKVQHYTLFKQMTKIDVNKLLHSSY